MDYNSAVWLYNWTTKKVRDEIEEYLCQISINESDELAVALAAGRYATMKLAQLTGEKNTKSFVDDCIKTTLNN